MPACRSAAAALVLAVGVCGARSPAAQEAQFRAVVDVFHVQVGVHDALGDFVPGLTAEDFELLVDGSPRPVVDAYAVDAADLAVSPDGLEAVAADATRTPNGTVVRDVTGRGAPAVARRHFLIFIDGMDRRSLRYARRAAVEFVDEMLQPSDLVGLVSRSRLGITYGLQFTSDHALVKEALESYGTSHVEQIDEPEAEGIPLEELAEALGEQIGSRSGGSDAAIPGVTDFLEEMETTRRAAEADSLFDALAEVFDATAVIEGRKYLIFFSRGLPDQALWSEASGAFLRQDLQKMADAAVAADTVIHTFHPSALPAPTTNDVEHMQSQWRPGQGGLSPYSGFINTNRAVLNFMSGETGGTSSYYRHTLSKGLRTVEESTRNYYVVAIPVHPEDARRVRIELRVRRPGVSVDWQPRGLVLPHQAAGPTDSQRALQVSDALAVGRDVSAFPFELLALPLRYDSGRAPLALICELPVEALRGFGRSPDDGSLAIEVLGMAVDRRGNVVDYFRGAVRSRAGYGSDPQPLRYYDVLVVPAGRYYVKLLLRDAVGGALATRSLAFEVPDAPTEELTLAPITFVASAAEAPMVRGAGPSIGAPEGSARRIAYPFRVGDTELTPQIVQVVGVGESRWLFVEAQGLTADPFGGQPRPVLELRLVAKSGAVLPLADPEVLKAGWDERARVLRLLLRIVVPDVPSGRYELRVAVTDAVAGARADGSLELGIR